MFRYFTVRNFGIPKIGHSTFGRSKFWLHPVLQAAYKQSNNKLRNNVQLADYR